MNLEIFALASIAFSADTSPQQTLSRVDRVATWLSGNFDSSAQAARDPDYLPISLKSCIVEVEGLESESRYLYVEQALMRAVASPYRQRIYRIGPSADGTVESEIMLVNNPKAFVGFCDQQNRVIQEQDFEKRGCTVHLQELNNESFSGSTKPNSCPSSFNGAVQVESFVTLSSNLLIAWDKGINASGNQVWGPEKGPYEFALKSRSPQN